VFAQFLRDTDAPLAAKSSFGELIAATADPKNHAEDYEAHQGYCD
jgi:hypothetical protein